MINTSRLARAAAAMAALTIAGMASAQSPGTFTPEIGLSRLNGKWVERDEYDTSHHSLGINVAFGWQHQSGLGVRALYIADLQPFRGYWQEDDRSFDNFFGVQATGSVPLGTAWNLKGGVGVGSTRLDEGLNGDSKSLTDGALSLGVQWRARNHFALELRVDHLTRSDVTSAGLQFQWPF